MHAAGERSIQTGHSPFFSLTRPRYYWDVVGTHLPLAVVTGIPLLLSRWAPMGLMPLKSCTFLGLTGFPCPFCGFTRSFWAMARGDWGFALYNSPLACLVYIAVAIVFAWNATGLLTGLQIGRGPLLRTKPVQIKWGTIIIGVLLMVNWAYRLSIGLK